MLEKNEGAIKTRIQKTVNVGHKSQNEAKIKSLKLVSSFKILKNTIFSRSNNGFSTYFRSIAIGYTPGGQ